SPFFLLTNKGKPLVGRTTGNNESRLVANLWGNLTDRVRVDDRRFRKLSFNKLRKTGINLMRMEGGSEIASLYAAHGRPYEEDSLLELYANKPFARMH